MGPALEVTEGTTRPLRDDDTVLEMRDISKLFPGTVALRNVSLKVRRGEVHGIIGKNGAGKSTLVNIIAGLYQATSGTILIRGQEIPHLTRQVAQRERVSIIVQEPQVIGEFSVAENLYLGHEITKGGVVDWRELHRKAADVLAGVGLRLDTRIKAADLSVSEQQLLLVIKACYVDNAEIIIFDEASASLTQADEKLLHEMVAERKAAGCTILFISHRVDELLTICDCVTVLLGGESQETAFCGQLDETSLASLIVGEKYSQVEFEPWEPPTGDVVLDVKNLTCAGKYYDVSVTVRRGEIVGIAGLRGSGRTEFMKGIAGVERAEVGSVSVAGGEPTLFGHPEKALKAGVAYLAEDREREGLVGIATVSLNCLLSSLGRVSKYGVMQRSAEKTRTNEVVKLFDIMTSDIEQEVENLSGGNKQKVLVGRIHEAKPLAYLLDEPTRGVDVGSRQAILRLVREQISKEAGVLMTSPGLEELVSICDRIIVMGHGRVAQVVERADFDETSLYVAVQAAGAGRDDHMAAGTGDEASQSLSGAGIERKGT